MNIDVNDLMGEDEIFIPVNKIKLDDLFNIKIGKLGKKFIETNRKIFIYLQNKKEINLYIYLLEQQIMNIIEMELKINIDYDTLNNKIDDIFNKYSHLMFKKKGLILLGDKLKIKFYILKKLLVKLINLE